MKVPILFVHGFGGGRYEFKFIEWYLRKKGYTKFYEFYYIKNFGQVSLRKLAEELSEFVKGNIKEKEIDMILISQGGIIGLYYLKHFNRKKVGKIITLCTPYQGSLTAYLLPLQGFMELRPGSSLLREINSYILKKRIDLYCIYSPLDLMIIPGWYAVPSRGRVKKVLAPLHPLVFWWPSTLKFIEESLRDKS